MHAATLNGLEMEYRVEGSGEPVLLIGTGPFADSFLPLLSEQVLGGRYRLIRYRQRGQAGGAPGERPVPFAQHAEDAAALLEHLAVPRAHIAGHSTGATIAMQLAADRPDLVATLALLEPPLMSVPSAGPFLGRIGPAVAAYEAGDEVEAMTHFLSVVCSLDRATCHEVVERRVPGAMAGAIRDAGTFFESYLPALGAWRFGPDRAAQVSRPILAVLGSESDPLFAESHALLHRWWPEAEDCLVDGVAHLLHIQDPEPVAKGLAEFFARHPIAESGPYA